MQHTEFKNSELARSPFKDNWPMFLVGLGMIAAVVITASRYY